MKKTILFGWLMTSIHLNSQDLHFSQFYASPLTLNPAMTGVFDGSVRFLTNYRSQWDHINTNTSLYQTPCVSADIKFPEKKIAVGLIVLNDQTNNKIFNMLESGLSVGYNIEFNDRFNISVGLQAWYRQVYYDFSKISKTVLQTETNLLESSTNLDFNTGLFATYLLPDEKNILFYGASVSHLLAPRDQSTNNTPKTYNLPLLFILHGGAVFHLNNDYKIMPGGLATYQAGASQINFGTNVAVNFSWNGQNKPNGSLYGGTWVRFNESKIQAFIPKVGIEYNNFRLGLSYDYILNNLTTNSGTKPNSFELSLSYIFKKDQSEDYKCTLLPYF